MCFPPRIIAPNSYNKPRPARDSLVQEMCYIQSAQDATIRIGDRVKLGVHAALRASDQSSKAPSLTRRLEAVRCAFK